MAKPQIINLLLTSGFLISACSPALNQNAEVNKGVEAAMAAIEMVNLFARIPVK